MKTAAAALAICLGLGCAAAGPPGDAAAGQPLEKRLERAGLPGNAAAGQPLEKRLERARRLSADACATETTTFSTCLADASITFTPATPAGPWASCADVQAEVAGMAPTFAPVTGAITFSGLSFDDALANWDVLVDAIAASAGVDKSRVSIAVANRTYGVIVTYSIATDTTADADALVTTLSALTTEDAEAALTTAAAAHGVAATFEAVTVTEVTVEEREDGALGSDAAAARGPLLATAVLGAAAAAL